MMFNWRSAQDIVTLLVAMSAVRTQADDVTMTSVRRQPSPINKSLYERPYHPPDDSFLLYMIGMQRSEEWRELSHVCTNTSLCHISTYHELVCSAVCAAASRLANQQRNASTRSLLDSYDQECLKIALPSDGMPPIFDNGGSITIERAGGVVCFGELACFTLQEILVEDMPFCPVYVIPLWRSDNYTIPVPLLFDFMPKYCRVAYYLQMVFDTLLAFCIVLINSFVLLYSYRTPNLRSIYGRFIVSLAVADLACGLVIVPFVVVTFYRQYQSPADELYKPNQTYVNTIGFLTALTLATSLLSLLCTASFRHLAVAKPALYATEKSRFVRYSYRCIAASWLTAATIGLGPIVLPFDHYFVHPMGMVLSKAMDRYFIYQAILAASLVLLWSINIATYLAFARKQTRVKKFALTSNQQTQKHYHHQSEAALTSLCRRRDKAMTKVLAFMFVAFTSCFLPLVITQSFSRLEGIHLEQNPLAFHPGANLAWDACMLVASRMVCLNSGANGLALYCVGQSKFRRFVRQLLWLRSDDEVERMLNSSVVSTSKV